MDQTQMDILKRALEREKAARKQAEKILEEKSAELYSSNQKLEKLNQDLESLLNAKDSQLKGVFETIVDAYIIFDLNGIILKLNKAALNLLGVDDDKIDFNLLELIDPSDYSKVYNSINKLLKRGSLTNLELKITTKQKTQKIVHINASVVYDKNVPVAVQGIVRDITKIKENELVDQIIKNITHSILSKDNLNEIAAVITDKIVKYLGTEDCVIYLYDEEDNTLELIAAYGEEIDKKHELSNKLFLKNVEGIVGSVAKSGNAEIINNTNIDNRYVVDFAERKSEITVPIKIGDKVIGVIDSEHKLENFYTLNQLETLKKIANVISVKLKNAVDLRDRNNVERRLIESESRMSSLISNLDTAVLLKDENRNIILSNSQFCNFFQIPLLPEQLIGMDFSNFMDQSKHLFIEPESFVSNINSIIEKKEAVLGEELKMVNGKIFERDYIPIYINNVYKGHLWSYKDVTLRRNYRNSLDAQRQKYRGIIANMNLGLVEFDKEDNILMVNNSFIEMSGYKEEELIGKNARKLFPTDEGLKQLKKQDKNKSKGITSSFELKVKNKAGETRYWLISGGPNFNINGEIIGGIGIHLDITNLKNLELQKINLLTELEKRNDQLQEYAHIVSHDLKSPLNNMYALITWIKEDNKDKLDLVSLENIKLIENSLEKMEQLITDVLEYSKAGINNRVYENVDINALVSDLLKLIYVPKNITIKVLNPLPTVNCDRIKLQQVFQNILANAIKYNDKDHGLVEIDVKDLNTHYKFSIKDNGIGIEKQYHKKIFKIFNSLNKSKDSTGIGLSIVKKIVKLHNGDIWLNSEPNIGTTFYFTIKK